MKKLLFILIAANGALSAIAQSPATTDSTTKSTRKWFKGDSVLSRWVVDINLIAGVLTHEMKMADISGNYTNGIAGNNTGELKFANGMSYGGDVQLGYFFGRKAHFGIGTGLLYMYQQGDLTVENFKVQYQSTDNAGNTFRQVISSAGNKQILEKVTVDNFNIPLFLKYKKRFTRRIGFTADAGILYNIKTTNHYKTDAVFDYEAIYQFTNPDNGLPTVYDNAVTPSNADYLITRDHYNRTHPGGDVDAYFNSQRAQGYNVGLGVKTAREGGDMSFVTGSVGFMFQPSLNFFLSDWCALNIGGYFLYQPYNNSVPSGYRLTDKVGGYSTAWNGVSSGSSQSYGGNLGLRFFFGKRAPAPVISFIDQMDPSACGSCDGSITLYGLPVGKHVNVTYNLNGISQTGYSGNVMSDGSVKLMNLCAGYYTDIVAQIGGRSAAATSVILSEPVIKISATTSVNPTETGKCDGSISMKGIGVNRPVTVNYNYNGTSQTPYSGVVGSDNTLTITGLCAGSYTGIVVSGNNCSGNATDVTLTAPPPPPVVKPRQPAIDPSTPILFDLGKTQIHESSLDILEEAVLELNDNKSSYIIIDGHTDDIGTPSSNRVLSYKRAQAVKEYLKEMGIDEKRLITVGHGDEQPIAPNTSSEGRAKNRRVIMTLRERQN